MKASVNIKALNSAAKVLANQIKALEGQGYEEMYFAAQFSSGGKKQNGIERGDVTKISKQVRDYVKSEEADTMNVEIFEESTGKSIYRRKFSNLFEETERKDDEDKPQQQSIGLGGFNGFGEVELNALVDKRVEVKEQAKDYARQAKELEDLKAKYAAIENEKDELEAELKAKKNLEFYSGIIGAAFPGLAPLFNGTPLAQAAGYLSGTGEESEPASPTLNGDVQSVAAMTAEFCNTLTPEEASSFHLLCTAFEKDRSKIKTFLLQAMA